MWKPLTILDRAKAHGSLVTWNAPSALSLLFLLPGVFLPFPGTHQNLFRLSSSSIPSVKVSLISQVNTPFPEFSWELYSAVVLCIMVIYVLSIFFLFHYRSRLGACIIFNSFSVSTLPMGKSLNMGWINKYNSGPPLLISLISPAPSSSESAFIWWPKPF